MTADNKKLIEALEELLAAKDSRDYSSIRKRIINSGGEKNVLEAVNHFTDEDTEQSRNRIKDLIKDLKR